MSDIGPDQIHYLTQEAEARLVAEKAAAVNVLRYAQTQDHPVEVAEELLSILGLQEEST